MAAFAQQHAEECTFGLSNAADRAGLLTGISWVGEGVHATNASQYEGIAEDVVYAWYDEGVNYSYDNNSCAPGKTCGQYTQVTYRSAWL